jgi:hypothetical protein
MSNINKVELEIALTDVRKAYRLLYSYQRRVMDTVKFIADTLSKSVNSGWAIYSSNSPRNGSKLNLDSWAWDWLNMYMYEFYFGETLIGENKINFGIILQSDTGAYDSEKVKIGTEIELFASPEESQTRVIFQLGKNRWKADGYHDSDFFSSKASNVLKEVEDDGRFFIAKSYPLSDVMDEDGIFLTLKDFIALSKELGVTGYFDESTLIQN